MQMPLIQITSLVYSVLIIFVFFLKKRQKSLENKIYSGLILVNFTGLIIDILAVVVIQLYGNSLIGEIFNKLLLVCLVSYMIFMTIYIYVVTHNVEVYDSAGIKVRNENMKEYSLVKKVFILVFIISFIAIFLLDITLKIVNEGVYSEGPTVYYVYIFSALMEAIWLFWMLKQIKRVKEKKFLPMFVFMTLGAVCMLVQLKFPYILLMVPMETLVTFLMYFTIENPDMKLIEQLNIARDQAEHANNAKTDFLSSMSHEIRTPLNAIVGFSNGLMDTNLDSQSKEDVVNIIDASSHLLELVNGILDISKIEAGKLEIVETNYDFKKMCEELCTLTKTRLHDKPIEFKYNYDETIPKYLYGDGPRLKQIILNFLTNAAKYTKEGWIEFKVSHIKINGIIQLIISIEDTGIGVKKENIQRLFSKFERLDVEKNTTVEGTGLGLAITKKLVELMGGKIYVTSELGKGSKFTVVVAVKESSQEAIQEIKSKEVSQKEIIDVKLTSRKVLIVDDNSLNLKVADRLLKKYEIDTTLLSSGIECLENIKSGNTYDLILLDDMMPKMSGTETYAKLKELDSFNIPVVVLTANAIEGMKEKYLALGFEDYLSKPIEKSELERVLNRFLVK